MTNDTGGSVVGGAEGARWIVGIDGSEDSLVALRWAVTRAAVASAAGHPVVIRAVSAWHVPVTAPVGVAGASVLVDWSDVEQSFVDRLEQMVASIDRRGVEIERVVRQGSAARVLLEEGAGADLLVVGSRGLAGFKELVLGSVSRQCATHAQVPTVVVPLDAPLDAVRRVVAGFDGSDNAVAALRWVLDDLPMLVPADAAPSVTVVGAFEISPFTDPEVTRARFPDEVADAEVQFRRSVAALDPDGRLSPQFSLQGARRAIAEAATGADLLVLGARGRGAVGAALLGSVCTWVLHHTPCAMVVVPG